MRTLIVILSIHIFSVMTKLLYLLNPEVAIKQAFSFVLFNEQTILSMAFALSYAIATATVLYHNPNKRIVILYASLDGIAILLYYFTAIPMYFTAFYFSIYTFVLIASTLTIKKPVKEKSISDLYKSGMTMQEIADQNGTSLATVSRKIKASQIQ